MSKRFVQDLIVNKIQNNKLTKKIDLLCSKQKLTSICLESTKLVLCLLLFYTCFQPL